MSHSTRAGINGKLKLAMASFQEYQGCATLTQAQEVIPGKDEQKATSRSSGATEVSTDGTYSKCNSDSDANKPSEEGTAKFSLLNLTPCAKDKEDGKDGMDFSDCGMSIKLGKVSEKHDSPKKAKKSSNNNKDKDYSKDFLLAEGSFGKVYQVTHKTSGERFAMKILS